MTITLKLRESPGPSSPFSWSASAPSPLGEVASLPSPPTQWLSAKEMKTYGAEPLNYDVGVVKCPDCSKPILKSAFSEHVENCVTIRKRDEEDAKKGKKRKAEEEPDDTPGSSKKKKGAPKGPPKGRIKGPVDLDRHCGVINDKGLPCSRSLTCKSHSMGAKRAVMGRSRDYNDLLLDWNRMYNPNFVEPVKKETKAQKKEKKDKEKAEKKRLAAEAAAAAGVDPATVAATAGVAGTPKKAGASGAAKKKKAAGTAGASAAAAAAQANADAARAAEEENWDEIDSEEELDALVGAVRTAREKGIIAVPLAVPADAGSWFVARRERLRNCKELLANALVGSGGRTGLVQPRIG